MKRPEPGEGRLAAVIASLDDVTMRGVLESAPDAIVVVDERGRIILVNAQTEILFGYSRNELLGNDIELLVPEGARESHRLHRDRYHAAAIRRPMGSGIELHGRRKDGRAFPVEISLSPVETSQGTLIASAIRDMTQRRAEEKRAQLAHDRALQAEQANRIKDEFLATLSHELRTPLNAILGWAQLLGSGNADPSKTAEVLQRIERNARTQVHLVQNLLDAAQMVAQGLTLRLSPVHLHGVLESSIAPARAVARDRHIAFEAQLPSSPMPISADVQRLTQAFSNILSNALEFTSPGGRIEVRAGHDDKRVRIVIRDTGRGIEPEAIAHVFEPFWQEDASTTREHGGLGLGLTIARHIVEGHGGAIAAHSAGRGTGTELVVELPLFEGASAGHL